MGTIVQFAERLAEDGDWTPAERSQLRDMGTQLAEATAGLDLVFGQTEEGDPWCVVADARNEVLLHVARIGGAFVVHSPRDDQMVEEYDLWKAVTRVLGGILRDRRGVILPFPPEAMGQPAALALILAAAIRGDFRDLIHNALPNAPGLDDRPEATPTPQMPAEHGDAAAAQARRAILRAEEGARQAAAEQGPQHHDQAAQAGAQHSLQASGPLDAQHSLQAVATADVVPLRAANTPSQLPAVSHPAGNGGGGGSSGNAGASGNGSGSTGAPDKPASGDEGSAGSGSGSGVGSSDAEHNFATHEVSVALGGRAKGTAGTADVFLLSAPNHAEAGADKGAAASGSAEAPVALGTISNFSAAEGDRLIFLGGAAPTVVETTELKPTGVFGENIETGHRIGYDLDGDGRPDAYLILLDPPAPPELVLRKAADTAVVVVLDHDLPAAASPESSDVSTTSGVFIGH